MTSIEQTRESDEECQSLGATEWRKNNYTAHSKYVPSMSTLQEAELRR